MGPRDRPAAGAFALALLGLVSACAAPAPATNLAVLVRVSSDPGRPVAGASILEADLPVSSTDHTGTAVLQLHGREGDAIDIGVRCPEEFVSPRAPVKVLLRGLRGARPEYEILCPPKLRTLVVAVRTEGAPGMAVRHLGREVAQTDESGTAHVMLRATPGERVELTLESTGLGDPWLFPRDPTLTFVAGNTDDVVPLVQRFVRKQPPPPKVAGKAGPCRLERGKCVRSGG